MKTLTLAVSLTALLLAKGALASEAQFPHLTIYANPYKTPEQEESFAHNSALDWDGLTESQQKKCLSMEAAPQIPWDPDKAGDPRLAPPNTYERLELCTSLLPLSGSQAWAK
jgi:hypothetical protein